MTNLITNASHGPGQTCLAFSKDGSRAFTGGQDCIVRIWDMKQGAEQEPNTASEADAGVSTISTTDDCWISGSEDSEVRRYVNNTEQLFGFVTTCNGMPVRSVAIDPRGKWVAVASDELAIKVVSLEDSSKIFRMEGHMDSIRRVTWHPSERTISSSGCDGQIIIWNLSEEGPVLQNKIDGVIPMVKEPSSTEYLHDCSAVWHPSGDYFFVVSRSHEIITISSADWSKSQTFSDKNVSGIVTALAVSPNGAYMASAGQASVHVWSTQSRRVIASQASTAGSTITDLAFSPSENLLAWTDAGGAFSRWSNPIPDNLPGPVKARPTKPVVGTSAMQTDLALFEDGLLDINALLDPVEDDQANGTHETEDDWLDDDVGLTLGEDGDAGGSKSQFVKEMVSITKAQLPFQPGATPMANKKRYLAHNLLGVIHVADQDTHQIITIEFFDRSTRQGFHFSDYDKFDLGYLGERGAVFACQPDNALPAKVCFKPYGSWSSQKEWTYALTNLESTILGVAAGGSLVLQGRHQQNDNDLQGFGNVIVATSEGDLTFLSGTGRERRILGLGADFVSMVAGPEWVFVVHRAGSTTIDGSQNLSYSMINFEDFSIRQHDVLPIAKGHVLKWIGITDQGAPAIYDSAGRVHVLTRHRTPHHASWARMLDTNLLERKAGKDESYWPVGITGNEFMCLILKGRQEHPGFPRPLIQELPIKMPFRRDEPAEERIERDLLYIQTELEGLDDELTTDDINSRERAVDKEFMPLIQAACKANNLARVLELARLLHFDASLDAAMKIAEFYHLVGLKEKLQILKTEREENEDRLELARRKRKQWLKPEAQPRQLITPNGPFNTRFDPLSDDRPPPAIERPNMTRVTVPVIEKTRYSSQAPPGPSQRAHIELSVPRETSPSSTDGKRKRSEEEGPVDISMPPPKQKTNPFARKAQETTRNPFLRNGETNKIIQKSESFFDKVDAAEAEPSSKPKRVAKSKDKKDLRQVTFDQLPKVKEGSKAKRTLQMNKTEQPPEVEATTPDILDIGMSDAQTLTNDVDETQPVIEDWEETQILDDIGDETQPLE